MRPHVIWLPVKIALLCLSCVVWSSNLFAEDEFQGDSFHALSNITASTITVKKLDGSEVRGVFDGNVDFTFKRIASFHSDKLIFYSPSGTRIERIELLGTVSMRKRAYEIRSQRAVSDDLNAHVMFIGDVVVRTKGSISERKSIKFNMRDETIEEN